MNLSAARGVKLALRGAAETIVLGAAALFVLRRFMGGGALALAAERGLAAAWGASVLSYFALIAAKSVSAKAFWLAWGSGVAMRLLVLAGLMAVSLSAPFASSSALLLSYVFGIVAFLPVEYWRLKEAGR